jgi:protein involved in plasmid replication-relaxation
MIRAVASRFLPLVLAAVLSVALLVWFASGGFTSTFRSGLPETARTGHPGHRAAGASDRHSHRGRRGAPAARAGGEPRSGVRRLAAASWNAAKVVVALLALLTSLLVASRTRARKRRRYRRYRLVPGRTDDATPERVSRMYETWQQQLLVRWWERLWRGQPALSAETHTVPARADDGTEPRFFLAVPDIPGLAEALEGPLRACYPDVQMDLVADRAPSWLGEVARLKKRHDFVRRIRTVERYEPALMDTLIATMATLGEPVSVQVTLTPVPALFDRFSRWLYRQLEHAERARLVRSGERGARSEVVEQELEGGLAVQHRPLFFVDIRVSARNYQACKLAAGAIRGESSSENRLVERRMRVRRSLCSQRIALCRPPLVPSIRKGVMSSLELASLWQLSSPYLKGVRMERSSVPRVPAPPEVHRPGRVGALGRDEHGYIGLRPGDWRMNLALVATQGVGKTSIERQVVEAAALDEDAAIFVLDPKSDLAEEALSVIPESRETWYCDFRNPEVGFNPFLADADPEVVADGIVAAFKDVFDEGEIMGSSDRYLRYSAIAALAAYEDPSLWDLYNLLLPGSEGPREAVAQVLAHKLGYEAPWLFFSKQLPEQLAASRTQFVARLEAPTNKIQRVLTPELQKVLRHPLSLDIDGLIASRGIAIFNGRVGHFGDDNVRVLMQFILHAIHRALIRQQELPAERRARVVLVVDEAHLLFSETFERMLAMDRSSGLECVAAWQSLRQVRDRDLRTVILGLLRNLCVGSVGAEDARELATRLQTAYVDSVRDDDDSRRRARISPDALINMPNHHFAASLIAGGSRAPSFVFETIPMGRDERRIRDHLEAQRARGARRVEVLVPPERVLGKQADDTPEPLTGAVLRKPSDRAEDATHDTASRPMVAPGASARRQPAETSSSQGGEAAARPETVAPPDFRPERAVAPSGDRGVARTEQGGGVRVGAPESLTELDLDRPTSLSWDRTTPEAPDRSRRRRTLRPDELETLAALWRLRFLFPSQIGRLTMPGVARRTVQHRLGTLHKQGLVQRLQLNTAKGGQNQRIYALTRAGFEAARAQRGPRGPYIGPQENWTDFEATDPRRLLHDLHANAWLIAFAGLAGERVRGYRGPRQSRLNPPGRMVRGEWVPLPKSELPLGSGEALRDLKVERFEAVHPDLTIEFSLRLQSSERRVDLLVEMDRTRKPALNRTKFHRYDALLTIWARALDRYRMLGEPPVVIFVCDDDKVALDFARTADQEVTGRIVQVGRPEAEWPSPARSRMFFVAEAEIHLGSTRAYRLPPQPPEVRRALSGSRRTAPFEPEELEFLPTALFRRRAG